MTILEGKNCEGCHHKDWCIFLTIFSKQVTSDDICPCEMCLIKMVCIGRMCEEYEALWQTIWNRWVKRVRVIK